MRALIKKKKKMQEMNFAFTDFVFTRKDDALIKSMQSMEIGTTVLRGKARRHWIAHASSLGFVTVKDFIKCYRRFCEKAGIPAEDISSDHQNKNLREVFAKYNIHIVAMGGVDFVLGIRHAEKPEEVRQVRQKPNKQKRAPPPLPNRARLLWQRAIRRQIKLNREDRRQTALNRVERRQHEMMCFAHRRAETARGEDSHNDW